MDPFFLVEIGVVAVIIALQLVVFFRNSSTIRQLGKIYPPAERLKVKSLSVPTSGPVSDVEPVLVVDENGSYSRKFQEILIATNGYLTRNPGAADFDILKDVAERKVESVENAIDANITLPLYIGLLATFTGVIIGLVRIAFDGVTDDAIQAFIGGVLIGMIGSATGLALTVRSNFAFKESKKSRDSDQYDYFTFLRTYILPVRRKDPAMSVSSLRENLAAFNEGFVRYQENMNDSLSQTLRLFGELKEVFQQIRSIEQGVNGMGHFLQANNGLIEKQIAYIDSYTNKAQEFTRKLTGHITDIDKQVGALVDENIKALDRSSQAAYLKMERYLSSIDKADNKAFAEALNKDLSHIRGDIETLQQKSIQVNARLLDLLQQESNTQSGTSDKITAIGARLEQISHQQENAFTSSIGFKLFIYSGVLAFLTTIAGGVFFLINQFAQ
ncbi:MAG: hypothetical protein SF052_04495 [Bacteroidia bacterium]|nr:hypothetical protein [Bacteroidia bacterium]